VLFVSADLRVSLRTQQHPKYQPAIRLLYPNFFCKLHSSSKPTNKNLTELSQEIQTSYGEERETNKMQLIRFLLSHFYLNMFRASLCPSSGEQDRVLLRMVFCTGCAGCGWLWLCGAAS